jgi:PhnB protein
MSIETQDVTQEAPATPAPQKGGVAPYLTLDGARKAADFYVKAFGAEIATIMPPDPKGRYIHIHLYINGSSVMLSDAFEDHGHPWVPPAGFSLNLGVEDADAWADRAAKAGAEVIMPVQDMFWGDRYGQVRDPFGVTWAFNQPKG